jgi:hypothetical protein
LTSYVVPLYPTSSVEEISTTQILRGGESNMAKKRKAAKKAKKAGKKK